MRSSDSAGFSGIAGLEMPSHSRGHGRRARSSFCTPGWSIPKSVSPRPFPTGTRPKFRSAFCFMWLPCWGGSTPTRGDALGVRPTELDLALSAAGFTGGARIFAVGLIGLRPVGARRIRGEEVRGASPRADALRPPLMRETATAIHGQRNHSGFTPTIQQCEGNAVSPGVSVWKAAENPRAFGSFANRERRGLSNKSPMDALKIPCEAARCESNLPEQRWHEAPFGDAPSERGPRGLSGPEGPGGGRPGSFREKP